MKFGKFLEKQTTPEWVAKYVDYKGIRKSLKKYKQEIESLNIHISELKAYNLNNHDLSSSKQTSPSTTAGGSGGNTLRNSISTSRFLNIGGSSIGQTPIGSSTPSLQIGIELDHQVTSINTSKQILESMGQLKEIQDRLVKSLIDEVQKVNDFYCEREKEAQGRFDVLKVQVPLYLKSKEKQRQLDREKEKEQQEQLEHLPSYSESYPLDSVAISKRLKKIEGNGKEHLIKIPTPTTAQQEQQPEIKRINQHHAILNLTPIKTTSPNTPLSPNGTTSSKPIQSLSKRDVKISLLSQSDDDEEEEEEDDEDHNNTDNHPDIIEMATVYHYDEDELEDVLSDGGSGGGINNNEGGEEEEFDGTSSNISKFGNKISNRLKEIGTQIGKPTTEFFTSSIGERAKRFMSMGKQKSDEALLKEAFREYYHYLVILKNYQVINYTGFVKIIKKAEKNTGLSIGSQVMSCIETLQFKNSKKVERFSSSIEKIHSELFNNGRIRDARKQLRNSAEHVDGASSNVRSMFFSGICTGWTSAILVLIYYFIYTREFKDFVKFDNIFNLYSAFGLLLLWAFVFGIDVYIWTKAHVHYSFIFELSKNKLNHTKIFQSVTLLSVMWITSIGVYMWQSVSGDSFPFPFFPAQYNPLVLLVVYLLILVCPFNIFQLPVRKWFLLTVLRVVTSPLKTVKFKDFFMGDQLSSLVLMMVQFSQFICFYSVDAFNDTDAAVCTKSGKYKVIPSAIISGLPAFWRLLQCFRRYYDSKDTVHLRNALKYSLSILVVICSTMDNYFLPGAGWRSPFRIIWVCVGISNSMYSYYWDIIMDWSIVVRPKGHNFNPFKWTLRKRRMYRPTFIYYVAIFSNLGFRLTWTFTKSLPQLTKLLPSYKLVVVIGIIEILRRGQWNIYRLENEHQTNCGKFRIIKEIPLPYSTSD